MMSTEQNSMFEQAMQAIDQRDIPRARDLLTRLIRADKENLDYWLWMSAVVETKKEKIYCMQQVLRIEPENSDAQYGLVLFGVNPPDSNSTPAPSVHRKWEHLYTTSASNHEQNRISKWRLISSAAAILTVIGLLIWGIFGSHLQLPYAIFGRHLTITPIAWTPTNTSTSLPIAIASESTTTPRGNQSEPTALIDLLEATYTPTPLYVNTPHPKSEAYQLAMSAYQKGDLDTVLEYIKQAQVVEPQAIDLLYHTAEIYRQKGNYTKATESFKHIIAINKYFAPAYLGMARTRQLLNAQDNISADLDNAIKFDPAYVEAYIERIAYNLNRNNLDEAETDLIIALKLAPDAAMLYLYQAQLSQTKGNYSTALSNAQKAIKLDITLLPVYKTLGQAYLLNHLPLDAVNYLKTYTQFMKQDADAWTDLGHAYYETNQDDQNAINVLNTALLLNPKSYDGYLYRGLAYLRLNQSQLAVNDFIKARQLDFNSFEASLWLGVSLQNTNRSQEALAQLNLTLTRAKTDQQKAMIFFWRAQIQESLDHTRDAYQDWISLLKLPKNAMPDDWISTANNHLQALYTPTPMMTPGRTYTPTRTPRVTPTRKPSYPLIPAVTPSP